MAFLIVGTWIFMAPKELPKEIFNLKAQGEVVYHATLPAGECTRHIETVRQTLVMLVGHMDASEMLTEEYVETICIPQVVIDPDNPYQDSEKDSPY